MNEEAKDRIVDGEIKPMTEAEFELETFVRFGEFFGLLLKELNNGEITVRYNDVDISFDVKWEKQVDDETYRVRQCVTALSLMANQPVNLALEVSHNIWRSMMRQQHAKHDPRYNEG